MMEKKSILFVTSADFTKPSAGTNRLLAIARGLCENGIKVYWVLTAAPQFPEVTDDAHYKQINFVRVGKHHKSLCKIKLIMYLYRLFLLVLLRFSLMSVLNDDKLSACFSTGDDFLHLWLISGLCKRNNLQLFHERTEYPFLSIKSISKNINMILYMKVFIPRCRQLFVISCALKDYFENYLRSLGVTIPVTILNMLVEPDRYSNGGELSVVQTRNIVYVGTMYGEKDGVHVLIEAFARIMNKYPDTKLIIVGDTSRPEKMRKVREAISKISELGRVELTGRLDRHDVIKIINTAYCLTLSRPNNIQAKYGFPTKLGEYLASGKPVVVTKVGDIPLFLADGSNAYLAEPDDGASFAQRLQDCLDDPKKAEQIGLEGKKLTNREFNYRESVKAIANAMNKSSNIGHNTPI